MPGNAAPSSRGIELQHHRHRHDQRHWPPSLGEHHGSGTNEEQHRHDGEEVADTSGRAPRTVASATANAGARTTARRRRGLGSSQ